MDKQRFIRIHTPMTAEMVAQLRAGDRVLISGIVYVARDAAHQRMVDAMRSGQPLPFDLRGQIIYYMGPSPARPGHPIGSAGPTTSGRMDPYTPALLSAGLKGMVGKGSRSEEVREALKQHQAVYLAVTGGAAALIARTIQDAEVVAYHELGPEAVRRLQVLDLPAIVINDTYGGDAYRAGQEKYRRVTE